jgi:hypothetical protein
VLLHSLELKNVAKRASNLTEAVHLRILQYRKPKTTRSKNLRIQKKKKREIDNNSTLCRRKKPH